jgi:protein-histidine pros-kinase
MFENYAAIAIGVSLYLRISLRAALARLTPGKPSDYVLVVLAWWLMSALLAFFYESSGAWSLAAFSLIALPLRQALARGESEVKAQQDLYRQRMVLEALSERIAVERRDERLRIANDIHDEAIPPLFKVSLLCQVTMRDLKSGRLLDLEADLEGLLSACTTATASLRNTVHDLRASPIGRRGLEAALSRLALGLQAQSSATFDIYIAQDLDMLPAELQLVIYQVAREALTNAAQHSRACRIGFALTQDPDSVIIEVDDDGIGFDSARTREDHFGLQIMQGRTESVGGSLYIDTSLGEGTKVSAHFPRVR